MTHAVCEHYYEPSCRNYGLASLGNSKTIWRLNEIPKFPMRDKLHVRLQIFFCTTERHVTWIFVLRLECQSASNLWIYSCQAHIQLHSKPVCAFTSMVYTQMLKAPWRSVCLVSARVCAHASFLCAGWVNSSASCCEAASQEQSLSWGEYLVWTNDTSVWSTARLHWPGEALYSDSSTTLQQIRKGGG